MDNHTFNLALDRLQNELPNHFLLPRIKGFDTLSIAYLRKAMESLPLKPLVEEIKPDSVIDGYYDDLRKLYIKRAQLSNSFHDVITDEDRSMISRDIQIVQNDIAIKLKSISYYKINGTTPKTMIDQPKYKLPDSEFELMKKLENKRIAVSRAKSNIAKRKAEGKDTARADNFLIKSQKEYEFIQRHIAAKGL
jgi:hypothetical protein